MKSSSIGAAARSIRPTFWIRAGLSVPLALASLASAAAAQGVVTAVVDGAGDLFLFGDDLDNVLRLGEAGDDTDMFRIQGFSGTTINGLAQITVTAPGTRIVLFLGGGANEAQLGTDYGGSPPCCSRDFLVVGGAGNDRVLLLGPLDNLSADLGPGDDVIDLNEGGSGIRGTFLLGTGDDRIAIDSFTGIGGFVDMGPGRDEIVVGEASFFGGTFELGDDDDTVFLEQVVGESSLFLGLGDDALEIDGVRGAVSVDAGGGDDDVRLLRDPESPEPGVLTRLDVDLGSGDDRLLLGSLACDDVRLDGGVGHDRYLDAGGNVFSPAPEILRFEVPLGGRAPEIQAPLSIAGRVVDEHGAPVADAHVLLPEQGVATTTDAVGAFVLGPFRDEVHEVDLVAGGTVRGQARTGAARVAMVPLGLSLAGDVVLQPGRGNALVFGSPGFRATALETNLLELGMRPEEVTVLATLPTELAPYAAIWHVGAGFTTEESARLEQFVRRGGGLVLSGGGFAANTSVERLVRSLVIGGGDIRVNNVGSATGQAHAFQPGAVGRVSLWPNALGAFEDSAFLRFVTGLDPENVLVVMLTSTDVPAAVWNAGELVGHRGRLLLTTDSSWMSPGESLDVLENFTAFLLRERKAQPVR